MTSRTCTGRPIERWVVLLGGTTGRYYKLLSYKRTLCMLYKRIYFLTIQTSKCMCLTIRVYGIVMYTIFGLFCLACCFLIKKCWSIHSFTHAYAPIFDTTNISLVLVRKYFVIFVALFRTISTKKSSEFRPDQYYSIVCFSDPAGQYPHLLEK